MVEKFGNQELIEALAGPVNAAISALTPVLQSVERTQAEAKRTHREALARTVQDFFTAKEMAPYAEIYGQDEANLTKPQFVMRDKVLETADALISGAILQGRTPPSVQDALTLAHDSVASPVRETIIRDKIRKDVKRREANITLRPTAQGRRASGGPPRDRQELFGRTEDRLAKAFS